MSSDRAGRSTPNGKAEELWGETFFLSPSATRLKYADDRQFQYKLISGPHYYYSVWQASQNAPELRKNRCLRLRTHVPLSGGIEHRYSSKTPRNDG